MMDAEEELIRILKTHFAKAPKRVLDIGSGGLRLSKFFVGKSEIDALDKKDYDLSVEGVNIIIDDMRKFEFLKEYELIGAMFSLQYLTPEEAAAMISKIKANTSEGGYNLFFIMSESDSMKNYTPNRFYPSLEEVKRLYGEGWDMLETKQDYTDYEEHAGMPRHRHNVIVFLARKNIVL